MKWLEKSFIIKKIPTLIERLEYMTDILEFFYIMVSNRVKTRIKETTPHKSYFEIYSNDPKQISWIVNNKRGKDQLSL